MIEFFEDQIEMEPHEEFPQHVQKSGQYVQRTGDALTDRWQEKAANGEKIDFDEAFTSDKARAQFEAIKERSRKKFKARHLVVEEAKVAAAEGDVHEDFTGGG